MDLHALMIFDIPVKPGTTTVPGSRPSADFHVDKGNAHFLLSSTKLRFDKTQRIVHPKSHQKGRRLQHADPIHDDDNAFTERTPATDLEVSQTWKVRIASKASKGQLVLKIMERPPELKCERQHLANSILFSCLPPD